MTKEHGERDFGDLHFILEEFRKKKKNTDRTQQHFIVPKSEIIENEYDLSVTKYKDDIYEEIKYDEPKAILEKLSLIETQIVKVIDELKAVL
jgi:type I restriction enzyme M protein